MLLLVFVILLLLKTPVRKEPTKKPNVTSERMKERKRKREKGKVEVLNALFSHVFLYLLLLKYVVKQAVGGGIVIVEHFLFFYCFVAY